MVFAEAGRARVEVGFPGSGEASVATGVPVLDHLLGLLAGAGRLDLKVEVEPGGALTEAAACGRALGESLAQAFGRGGLRGIGSAHAPADEALAHVVLEASGRPRVVSNVDLAGARVGGAGADVVTRLLDELSRAAGLTLHVRLLEGEETEHVLEAIFKALGGALEQALSPA